MILSHGGTAMKLEQIDHRLTLFSDYLRQLYLPSLHNVIIMRPRRYGVSEMYRIFEETGNLIINDKDCTSLIKTENFDQWLFDNRHYDLVDYSVFPKEEGLIDHVKNKGTLTNFFYPTNMPHVD